MYMHITRVTALTLAMALASACGTPAFALDAIGDQELSEINGMDGQTIQITDPAAGIAASSVSWITAGRGTASQMALELSTVNLRRIDTTRPLLNVDVDVGALAGVPQMRVHADMARSRLDIGSIGLTNVSGSFGRYVIDAPATFTISNSRGLLDSTSAAWSGKTTINVGGVNPALWAPAVIGAADPGRFYWQQGSSQLSMGDYTFYFDMQNGRIGADSNGILVQSNAGSNVRFALSIDFRFDANNSSPFAIDASDRSLLYWGWRGNWTNFLFRVSGGNRIDGGKGLKGSVAFDYVNDFVWMVGEGGSSPVAIIEFGNWSKIPGNTYAFNIPLVRLDQLDVGQGTAGLCWGLGSITTTANGACSGTGAGPVGSAFPVQPIQARQAADGRALGLSVRDMTLAAYSTTVDIIDRTVTANKAAQRFNWALIYTFADLDADIIITPASTSDRLRLDLALTTQTLTTTTADRWTYGTNFMIGDTDPAVNQAIGLGGADVLMAVRNGTLGLTTGGIRFDTSQMRYEIRGMLAGGGLSTMTSVQQQIGYVDLNLESDRFVLNLFPSSTGANAALGFNGYLNIANTNFANFSRPIPATGNHTDDDGSFFSIAEPDLSKLGVDFRFADIRGSLEFLNGKVDLQGDSDSTLRLLIATDIKVGLSATVPCAFGVASCTAVQGSPLQVGRLEFGGKNLGTLIMPTGIVRTQITLKPQVP
jgi:hypothetical protein